MNVFSCLQLIYLFIYVLKLFINIIIIIIIITTNSTKKQHKL